MLKAFAIAFGLEMVFPQRAIELYLILTRDTNKDEHGQTNSCGLYQKLTYKSNILLLISFLEFNTS